MRFCKKCGAALDEDSVFCANCGTKVTVSEVASAENLSVSFNNKEATEDTAFKKADTGIFEPVYSTDIGFFRYNFEKECLEFINHQTKMVAEVWNIPRDQWEGLPSQAEYCENIVDQENKAVFLARKKVKKIVRSYIFIIIGWFVSLYMLVNFGGNLGEWSISIALVIWLVVTVLIVVHIHTRP